MSDQEESRLQKLVDKEIRLSNLIQEMSEASENVNKSILRLTNATWISDDYTLGVLSALLCIMDEVNRAIRRRMQELDDYEERK